MEQAEMSDTDSNGGVTATAIEQTRRVDRLALEMFGDAYTLKTTFWNDGDFRIIAYCSKVVEDDEVKGAYVELCYQHSRNDDDEVFLIKTEQYEDVPRTQTELEQVDEGEVIDLPPVDSSGGE